MGAPQFFVGDMHNAFPHALVGGVAHPLAAPSVVDITRAFESGLAAERNLLLRRRAKQCADLLHKHAAAHGLEVDPKLTHGKLVEETGAAQPAEVLVDDGQWSVIRRRQTIDDVLALES